MRGGACVTLCCCCCCCVAGTQPCAGYQRSPAQRTQHLHAAPRSTTTTLHLLSHHHAHTWYVSLILSSKWYSAFHVIYIINMIKYSFLLLHIMTRSSYTSILLFCVSYIFILYSRSLVLHTMKRSMSRSCTSSIGV